MARHIVITMLPSNILRQNTPYPEKQSIFILEIVKANLRVFLQYDGVLASKYKQLLFTSTQTIDD